MTARINDRPVWPLLTLWAAGLALMGAPPAWGQSAPSPAPSSAPPSIVVRAETAPGEELSPRLLANRKQTAARRSEAAYWLMAGGVGGGMLVGVAGAQLGHVLVDEGSASWIPLGTLMGGFVGISSGIPVGVHLANGRRGTYFPSLLASTGVGVGGVLLTTSVHRGGSGAGGVYAALASTVLGQIGVSIAIERATAH